MYEISIAEAPARPGLSPAGVGWRWVVGYWLLGCVGGALAFLIINVSYGRLGWTAEQSTAAAWTVAGLVAAPLGLGLQHYLLRPFGMRFRAWVRASWLTLGGLLIAVAAFLGLFAALAGISPATLFQQPILLLKPIEALAGRPIDVPERAIVLGLRGGLGLLFGLAQARAWRSIRVFRWSWPLACAAAGLLSGYGEELGWWLAENVVYNSDGRTMITASTRLARTISGGALYWGTTWLLMGLITAGPVIYLVRHHQRDIT